ncbi:cation:proton antiporter [Marinicellulosiphila megalodicopiae]|uniref:cation:proton antiporter domain-containing protein n=1 Tax=Marinicellulosiphila megalodicopiae TaxID=2724896 RepID=UPI003BB13E2C
MDLYLIILIAFIAGFAVKQIGLPPMLGYLFSGFVLFRFYGEQIDASLFDVLADLGITLLLFTIGLKVKIKDLVSTPVLAGAIAPMGSIIVIISGLFTLASTATAWLLFDVSIGMLALIAFSLSFSSTICIAKIFEEKGELKTRHGKVSLGILVIQDFAAVIFLVVAKGSIPEIWAIGLLLIIPGRILISEILNRAGHAELLPLAGFFLALGCYSLFEFCGVKGDLGALLVGMLISGHPKSAELYKSLMNFKDFFLIGFFLAIGFSALPTGETWLLTGLLVMMIPVKFVLFFSVLILVGLRARAAFLSSLALMNFSEFGLIVLDIATDKNWISDQWLVAMALSISVSFIITSVVFKFAHVMFVKYKPLIVFFERKQTITDICTNPPIGANVLIVGMGRVGSSSYDSLKIVLGNKVWGVDADSDRAQSHKEAGRNVALADAEDGEFWGVINLNEVKLIMLALPSMEDMKNVIIQLKMKNYTGKIAAVTQYSDDAKKLEQYGADTVFNYQKEVGQGFAQESIALLVHVDNQ